MRTPWISVFLVMTACASTTPGAQPHDMSAAAHDSMAANEAATADTHAAKYDPNATAKVDRCDPRGGMSEGACWTSTSNPTSEHIEEAKRHRKMAADHRAASQALRDAEAHSCAGISDADRDMSPFDHREDIASVEPLTEGTTSGKAQLTTTTGAIVTFRAVRGMTAQWLQRVIDCHLARNASLGHDVPEMPSCPLVPKGASAKVSATQSGFAVAIRGDDGAAAQEILKRAQSLVGK